jgi:ATP/maltotriose-dependent transcriptional regulator MalT
LHELPLSHRAVCDQHHSHAHRLTPRGDLTFLLDHLPPRMRLVIATRVAPLPLARLCVRDQLFEIRAADLQFTPEKVAAFLNEVFERRGQSVRVLLA